MTSTVWMPINTWMADPPESGKRRRSFWKTKARYEPGKLVGAFVFFYGLFRFGVEFIREPDAQFKGTLFENSGLHMGQWLSLPMILLGLYLMLTAAGRRVRVEPTVGTASVA